MPAVTPRRSSALRAAPAIAGPGTRTLCIDIGGTGIKAIILDAEGVPLTDRARIETPRPATPKRVLSVIWKLIAPLGPFDRISVGFPGVVNDGVTKTAPNLHKAWNGFELGKTLAEATRRPVRVLNDAGIQGYGVIEGYGVEMLITLGTGMGCSLFLNGKYVPNLELAHHPFHGKKTYEDWVGNAALKKLGKKRWNQHVSEVIGQIEPIWNFRKLYIGGGNARRVKLKLPANVSIVPNVAGLLGGIALWHDREKQSATAPRPRTRARTRARARTRTRARTRARAR
jgi:polyphosphate glucokinase